MRAITTERAIDTNPASGDRAARLRVVAVDGVLVETRDALRIRPLIDHPALRRAMGLDADSMPGRPRPVAPVRRFDRRALLESAT